MKINNLSVPYVITKFNDHNIIKETVLFNIETSTHEKLEANDQYFSDNIHKLDWHKKNDFERPWVKQFLPFLNKQIYIMIKPLGFENFNLPELWYQQYLENGKHGWHVHGGNYTGVYYLEMPKESPKTQIVDPSNMDNIIDLNVQEGDFVIFPSFVIHRAPKNKSHKRKTIISFNVYFDKIIKGYEKERT
tara:strand:+ start:1290 stop:1859 length:570 start_codon:yes stop_codon:yes gene_type:complete